MECGALNLRVRMVCIGASMTLTQTGIGMLPTKRFIELAESQPVLANSQQTHQRKIAFVSLESNALSPRH